VTSAIECCACSACGGTCSSFLTFRVYFAVFVFYADPGILIWEVSCVRAGTYPDEPVRVGSSCERWQKVACKRTYGA
jgi:hypothetical protein